MAEKKYLDYEGLSLYHDKIKETFLPQNRSLTKEEIEILFKNFSGNIISEDLYELKVKDGEIVLQNKRTSDEYVLSLDKEENRVISLTDTQIAPGAIVVETVGSPKYIETNELNSYQAYNLTSSGWYIFARIQAKKEVEITDGFEIKGAEGYKIPSLGDTFVDVAIKFDVTAESQLVTINWGKSVETFVFKATDLAVRNLDYRVTFYLYNIDDYTTWEYQLTTDTNFVENRNYYTKQGKEYTLANVTVDEEIPADTYYVHSNVIFKDFVKNVSYCCDSIDCPVTIYLPEVDDENYGAWFEVQTQFDTARSITIIPSENTKVSGKGVATPKAGINIINFQFHKPTKTWLPTVTNWALSSN